MFRTLRFKIIVALGLSTTVVFGALSFYTFNRLQRLPSHILKQYEEIADTRANEVSLELKGLLHQIEMIAHSNVIAELDNEKIKPHLRSLSKQNHFISLTIADMDGNAWSTNEQVLNISKQQQFKDIILNNKTQSISDPFYSPFVDFNEPIITISHAITSNGTTVGIVNGVISTGFIDDIVRNMSINNMGHGFVINQHGDVIGHPDDSITMFDSFSSITSLNHHDLLNEARGSFSYISEDNQQMLGVYSTINYSNNWKLILTIDKALAYSQVNNIIQAIGIAFMASLLVLILFTFWFSHRFTKPILDLKGTFEKAMDGNLNVKANESTLDEFGDTAKSFNAMLSKIKQLTFIDPITGLTNYFSFFNNVHSMYLTNEANQQSTYIVIVSVDNFKKINNFYGYAFGNQVLKKLADTIASSLDSNELISRYFSDEMLLCLHGKDQLEVESKLQAIHSMIDSSFEVSNINISLNLSFGVAHLDLISSLEDIVRQATMAKFKAKSFIGGKVIFYDDSILQEIQEKQRLEDALNNALSQDQLYLMYQPMFDLNQDAIIGYEALLRWNHPEFKHIPISTIIELAETNGTIIPIGEWVFKTATQTLKRLQGNNPSLFMSINVSSIQLMEQNFLSFIQDTLKSEQINPETLTIEITETTSMMDVDEKQSILLAVKELGCKISIDDFGTGYSSLSYLSQLPIDTIKIDKQFVQQMDSDSYSHTLVSSVIAIAQTLQLAVIAEGVETKREVDLLKSMGCTIIQGYYISKPVSLMD